MLKKYTNYIALFSLSISHQVCAQVVSSLNNPNASSGFGLYQAPISSSAPTPNAMNETTVQIPSSSSGFGLSQTSQTTNSSTSLSSNSASSMNSIPTNVSGFGSTQNMATTTTAQLETNSQPNTTPQDNLPNQNVSKFGGNLPPVNKTPVIASNSENDLKTTKSEIIQNLPTAKPLNIATPSSLTSKEDELQSIQALSKFEIDDPFSKRNSAFGQFQTNSIEDESSFLSNNQNLQLGKGLTLLPDDDIVGSNSRSGKTNIFGYKKLKKKNQNAFLIPGKKKPGLIVTSNSEQQNSNDKKENNSPTIPLDDQTYQETTSSSVTTAIAEQVQNNDAPPPAPASKGGLLDSITSIATAVATVADTFSGTKASPAPAPSGEKNPITASAAVVTPSSSNASSSETSPTENEVTNSDTPKEIKSLVTQEVSTQLPPLVQAEVAKQLGQIGPNNAIQPLQSQNVVSPPNSSDQQLEELPIFVAK